MMGDVNKWNARTESKVRSCTLFYESESESERGGVAEEAGK